MSHDSPMMIRFVRNEMKLKTTLLLCDPIIIVNVLVSHVIGFEQRFQPSIISIATSVAFSTNAKLCCCTNSLSLKHVDAPESRSVWVHTIVDLTPLIVMGNKKQDVGFKNKASLF
jgi:hypothetical protein